MCDVQHRKTAERGLLSLLSFLTLHVIKRNQAENITDLAHPQYSNGNSHMALGDRRSEMTTAESALGCARVRQPRLGLAVRCGDLALSL